ncbi:hypothetical protein V8G54_003046, partial [Vigna mungo]
MKGPTQKIHCKTTESKINIRTKFQILEKLCKKGTYLVIPCMVPVVDNGCSKTPSRVNSSSCDGNGRQVDQEHSKSDGKWSQNLQLNISYHKINHIQAKFGYKCMQCKEQSYRNVRISGVSLGISCRENGVDKNKSANNLSSKSITFSVSRVHKISS